MIYHSLIFIIYDLYSIEFISSSLEEKISTKQTNFVVNLISKRQIVLLIPIQKFMEIMILKEK